MERCYAIGRPPPGWTYIYGMNGASAWVKLITTFPPGHYDTVSDDGPPFPMLRHGWRLPYDVRRWARGALFVEKIWHTQSKPFDGASG